MDINDRIKEVRMQSGLTQTEFGERCGLGRCVIANIELRRNTVTKLYIKLIADSFGVNEEWLVNGTGEMFAHTKEDYINQFVQNYNGSKLLKKVIKAFIGLDSEERKAVLKFIGNLDLDDDYTTSHGKKHRSGIRELTLLKRRPTETQTVPRMRQRRRSFCRCQK